MKLIMACGKAFNASAPSSLGTITSFSFMGIVKALRGKEEAGSEATRQMVAVHGRAAYYAERSIGILDGGSVGGKLIFKGIAGYYGAKQ